MNVFVVFFDFEFKSCSKDVFNNTLYLKMDKLLNETAAHVAKEIDLASHLLEAISLIPTSHNDEFLEFLEPRAGENDSSRNFESKIESEEKRQIKAKVLALWEVEKSISHHDQGNELLTAESARVVRVDQGKEQEALLYDAIISVAMEVIQSSVQTRQFLLQKKKERDQRRELTDSNEEIEAEYLSKVRIYLNQLKDVGCKDISLSVEKEQKATTELFKLREKCKVLEEEKAKMSEHLEEKQRKTNEEKLKLSEILEASTKTLKNLKDEEKEEQETSDKKITAFLAEKQKKHNSVVASLSTELRQLQQDLDRLRHERAFDVEAMSIQRVQLEEKLSRIISQYKAEEQKQRSEILEIVNKTTKEQEEKANLEKQLALQDLDDSKAKYEQALIQSVIDLESKADSILFIAAAQLQKLYRGKRDRAAVKKLKKKSKKGKKLKGKKSKTNK